MERLNTGDGEGLVALYEPEAALVLPPSFAPGEQRPALRRGEPALTSTRLPGGGAAEIARRQADGTWLWVIDRPDVLGQPPLSPPPRPGGSLPCRAGVAIVTGHGLLGPS